jgi:hypothetical protein
VHLRMTPMTTIMIQMPDLAYVSPDIALQTPPGHQATPLRLTSDLALRDDPDSDPSLFTP